MHNLETPIERPFNAGSTDVEQLIIESKRRYLEAQYLVQLWLDILPLDPPMPHQFQLWLRMFGINAVVYGLDAGACAYNKRLDTEDEMALEDVVRYSSACMRNYLQREAK